MRHLGACLAAAIPAAVYLPVLGRNFVNWDDDLLLLHNPHIEALTWANIKWMFTSLYMTTYQPLGWLAYSLLAKFRGLDALAFHQANLSIHAANTAALYFVVLGLLKTPTPRTRACCLLAALAWSLHPLQVESVAWATQLPDLLATLFFFLSLLAYQRGRLRLAIVCFAASGLARWKGVSLPLVLLLTDHFRGRGVNWRNKAPFLMIAACLIAVNGIAKAQIQGIQMLGALRHPLSAAFACYFYLEKALLPFDLMPLYRFRGPMLAGALLAAALTSLAWARRRDWPAAFWSWVWYLAAILPTTAASNEGRLFGQDHYAYLAAAGFALPLAQALSRLPGRATLLGLAACLLPVLGAMTRRQAVIWHDSVRLWTQAVSVDPGSCTALGNLGSALLAQRRYDEAVLRFREEFSLCPRDPVSRAHRREALERRPRFEPVWGEIYSNMGVDRFDIGKTEEAVEYFARALQAAPNLADAHRNMALALSRLGKVRESARHAERFRRLRPVS